MADRTVAYVLKGYPRISELFIASEIWRLEQLGVRIRPYVLKPSDEESCHRVVEEIVASRLHFPATTSLPSQPAHRWVRDNGHLFSSALRRTLRHRPLGLARAACAAAAQSVRARKGWRLRKVYLKEILLAVLLADHLRDAPDVVHLHANFGHGTTTVTWLASLISGVPFSFTGHAKDIYRPSLNPAGLLARKMRAAAFVTTCTAANRDHLHRLAAHVPVELVYHGLNADFSRLVTWTDPPPEPVVPRIVSVGRTVAKKGFDVLLDAIALLRDRGAEIELVIAGEAGDEQPALEVRVDELGLRSVVTFLGPLSQPELYELYRAATVFALACRVVDDGDRDGIPNVLMEAMAAGLPVVSTEVSGIPELITDDENGLLVGPEDVPALATAMCRVISDAGLRRRLSLAGRRTVSERFDGDRLAGRMAELFDEAIDARR